MSVYDEMRDEWGQRPVEVINPEDSAYTHNVQSQSIIPQYARPFDAAADFLYDFQPAPDTMGGQLLGFGSDVLGHFAKAGKTLNPLTWANALLSPPDEKVATDEWRNQMSQDMSYDPATGTWNPFTDAQQVSVDAYKDATTSEGEAAALAGLQETMTPTWEAPAYTMPSFDEKFSEFDEPFNQYVSLLEGMTASPDTTGINELLDLAMGEANRRTSATENWGSSALANIETDSAALMENLGMLTNEFWNEYDIIRERQDERIAGSKETRNDRIDQAIEEYDLGEAAATFLVSSTKTSDILEAQGNRQQQYSDRLDRMYAGMDLDRKMDALNLTQQAKRDVANQMLAMKENIASLQYDAQRENIQQRMDAEQKAAAQNRELAMSIGDLTYNQDMNRAGAEQQYEDSWDRAMAWLTGPQTGWALEGMAPEQVMALPDDTLKAMVEVALSAIEPSDDPLMMTIGGYPVEAPNTYSELENYAASEGNLSMPEAGAQMGQMTGITG